MRTVSVTEFRTKAAKILGEVAASGEAVTVTRRGKPMVRVERVDEVDEPSTIVLGKLRDKTVICGDIVEPVFDQWETPEPRERKTRRGKR